MTPTKLRLLIVDDSPAMRQFIQRTLSVSGLEMEACVEAGNGQEALELLADTGIDMILTDINMPVMDGEAFVRKLRQDSQLQSIPVVVISTDTTHERIREMVALGAVGYVDKPFSPESLSEEIERVLIVTNYSR